MVSGGLIAPEGAHDIIKEGQGEQKVLTVTEMEDVERMRQLEQGWNNKINIEKHSRRILTYGEDIRTFLNKSMTPKTGAPASSTSKLVTRSTPRTSGVMVHEEYFA